MTAQEWVALQKRLETPKRISFFEYLCYRCDTWHEVYNPQCPHWAGKRD